MEQKYYRYYQQHDHDLWRIEEDSNPRDPWRFAEIKEASRVSVLCVSEDLDITKNAAEVLYSGNLFFDIDDGADLKVALKSANQLVAKLLALGVDPADIECHLSGKKGVHIYIDSSIFMEVDAVQKLPDIYARMAMQLWVEGMDFAVYSEGKGRMVRPVNAKRPDGKYKVQISTGRLRDITTEVYQEMTASPQAVLQEGPRKFCPKLSKLFKAASAAASTTRQSFKPVAPSDLAKLGGVIPNCVEMLAAGKRKKIKGDGSTSFNSVAMQVGCWSRSSIIDQVLLDSVHERIAMNNPSSSGETKQSRIRKLRAMHQYLASRESYQFSCAAIKKIIDGTPSCSSCAVYESMAANGGFLEALFLKAKHGHYYSDKECTIMVAPFNMTRDSIVINEATGKVITSTVLVHVPLSGDTYTLHNFSEDAWVSKQNLKKELAGIDGIGFFGTDNDVARLRMTLAKEDLLSGGEVKQVYEARKIGVEYRRRAGPEDPRHPDHKGRVIYIEPGFSLNDVGVIGTHMITSDTPPIGAPNMKVKEFNPPLNAKANQAFRLLVRINRPEVISVALGWFLATHLKSHVYALEHRFPLLSLAGIPETGKNALAAVMLRLCGVEGQNALVTLEAPQSSQFPFQEALSNSASIPRVINEMNRKSVSRARYRAIVELLKAAFDSQSISRGRLGGGDRGSGLNVSSLHWKITAPLVVLSEEPLDDPALLHRTVCVNLTKAGLLAGSDAFMELEPRADDLVDFGRVLIRQTLATSIQEISVRLDGAVLPEAVTKGPLPERLKFGYKIILLAYDWAIDHLSKSGLTAENLQTLKDLRQTYIEHLDDSTEEAKNSIILTEVDLLVKDLAVMAYSSMREDLQGQTKLLRSLHYAVMDDTLYLDMPIVFPALQAYKKSIGEYLNIHSQEVFMKLVKTTNYFVSSEAHTELIPSGGRPVLALSISRMLANNIPATLFH